jgi:hypothetical protein
MHYSVHTALFSFAYRENKEKAQALPELSQFHDFFSIQGNFLEVLAVLQFGLSSTPVYLNNDI